MKSDLFQRFIEAIDSLESPKRQTIDLKKVIKTKLLTPLSKNFFPKARQASSTNKALQLKLKRRALTEDEKNKITGARTPSVLLPYRNGSRNS